MKWMAFIFVLLTFPVSGQQSIAFLNKPNLEVRSLSSRIPANGQAIPMQIIRGMIYLEAEMNGQKGHFILDTGAPMLVVNQKMNSQNTKNALSFGEGISVMETQIASFNLANIHQENIDALALDMSHLEKASGKNIMGLIGYNVLAQFELFFDFDQQLLHLIQIKAKTSPSLQRPFASIDFKLYDHLPIVKVKIGGKTLRLGIDTGAASNLMDERVLADLDASEIQYLPKEEIQGLDQKVKVVQSGLLQQLKVKNSSFGETKFLFTDLSFLREHTGYQIDGLLGSPFFAKASFSINYPKKKINIWSEQ